MTSCAQQSRDKLQQLERDREGFLENLAATQQAISAACDELKSLLDPHPSRLMEELNAIKTKRLKEIECKRDELERQCIIVESFKKYCEEMKKRAQRVTYRALPMTCTRDLLSWSKRKSSTTVSSSTELNSHSFLRLHRGVENPI